MTGIKIIISPAKKMNIDSDTFSAVGVPVYLDKTRVLLEWLRGLTMDEAGRLWKCNEKLTRLNYDRIMAMDLDRSLTPAVISYEGIQYQYMSPHTMEDGQLDYLQENLRILSGFYGVLKPFDGVSPYRLEMQAEVSVGGCKSLYDFWGSSLYDCIAGEDRVILNLASKEYSKAVEPHLKSCDRFVTCVFGELKDGKVVQKATLAKMARGEMVRFLSGRNAGQPEAAKEFDGLGFAFDEGRSDGDTFVFVK